MGRYGVYAGAFVLLAAIAYPQAALTIVLTLVIVCVLAKWLLR